MEKYIIDGDMLDLVTQQVYLNRIKNHEEDLDKLVDDCFKKWLEGASLTEIQDIMYEEIMKILEGDNEA